MPGRKGVKGRDTCTLPFHYCYSQALTSGLFQSSVLPALFPRVATEADAWAHYRFKAFSFRLHPSSPKTVAQAAGFCGGIQDTAPATFNAVVELIPSCVNAIGSTVPCEWVRVPKTDLAGPFPWYKTIAGAADPTEESPGTITVVGTGTETMTIEFRGIIEFKTSVATANTPLALQMKNAMRQERLNAELKFERDTLLRILSTTTPPSIGGAKLPA
jgi:hypothetical protein